MISLPLAIVLCLASFIAGIALWEGLETLRDYHFLDRMIDAINASAFDVEVHDVNDPNFYQDIAQSNCAWCGKLTYNRVRGIHVPSCGDPCLGFIEEAHAINADWLVLVRYDFDPEFA